MTPAHTHVIGTTCPRCGAYHRVESTESLWQAAAVLITLLQNCCQPVPPQSTTYNILKNLFKRREH